MKGFMRYIRIGYVINTSAPYNIILSNNTI